MAAPPPTEPLLAAFLAGRPGAADALAAHYRPIVRDALARFLAWRGRGRLDLADDLTHDVFVALLRDDGAKLRGFEGRNGCSLAGWLRVVAVRLAIDRLRRDRRLVSMDDDSQRMQELRRALRTDEPEPEQTLAGAELADDLRLALADLAPKDRVLVELHLVRGAALDEVARVLGVTPNAVYVRKHRVLERLRRRLREAP